MTDSFVIAAPPRPSVAVAGSDARFPVHRIYCVGRNYAAHTREMGRDPDREAPFFFQKPADAVVADGATIPYPPETADLHHEVELVVALGRVGRAVQAADAGALIWGAGVGVDLTRRDLQAEAKAQGRPWDWAKGFDRSAPLGPLTPIADPGALTRGAIWLSVNGERRQTGDLSQMIWPVAAVIAAISRSMVLHPGDLIMTGTPAGVGPVAPGDTVSAGIDGLPGLKVRIGPAEAP